MLRPYKLTSSKIHRIQSFVNHVMLQVIFRAPYLVAAHFDSSLVYPKYKDLIDNVNPDYIKNPLSQAFSICKRLTPKQLKVLKKAVYNNNKIRELCDGVIEPIRYEEIESIDPNLKIAIKFFCDNLYDHSIGKAPFYNTFGNIDEYYNKIVKRSSVCRCCGINKILTKYHSHRSALDHYLPRKYYPFNSVNFKNLFPICDICNSKYKLSEDPLLKTENKGKRDEVKHRTKAFYPFCRNEPTIAISISFKNIKSIKSIEPENIDLKIDCAGAKEQIETWDRVFGIQEVYKAECCTDEMLAHYEEQYIADINYGKSHEEYVALLTKNKYADGNFLKVAFLNAIAS
jgi:hypothetical protein